MTSGVVCPHLSTNDLWGSLWTNAAQSDAIGKNHPRGRFDAALPAQNLCDNMYSVAPALSFTSPYVPDPAGSHAFPASILHSISISSPVFRGLSH